MFEVKATTGDQAEFLLTDVEIARAQHLTKRERDEILFITHVFDGERRRIHRLPNPLDPRTSRLYRTVGDDVRYRFTFADDAQGDVTLIRLCRLVSAAPGLQET